MSQCVEISDDECVSADEQNKLTISLSSDEENDVSNNYLTSDDDELPTVNLRAEKAATIEKLFGKPKKKVYSGLKNVPSTSMDQSSIDSKPIDPGVNKMIAGVNVNLPVNPYGCQLALMSTLIRALKNGNNCLLESPTGSGKTLALLCGALAWLNTEKTRISELPKYKILGDNTPMDCSPVNSPETSNCSPLKRPCMNEGSPVKGHGSENLFQRNHFGEKSIYDTPGKNENINSLNVPKEISPRSSQDSPVKGQVNIHKRPKVGVKDSIEDASISNAAGQNPFHNPNGNTVPRIFYGARTHKQLEQVIKEFGRTSYCKDFKMTVLSSREYSCIREFDKQMWGTKNEMCKGCLKKVKPKGEIRDREQTNCKYYDNRVVLRHDRLPPTFDLEDLVRAGQQLTACPYFAAREMMLKADIIFCPYNYLIDRVIRNSMRMGIDNSVIIIDEAHNIEDVCRDAATFSFTREDVGNALKELEVAAEYRFSSGREIMIDLDQLIIVLKNWDQWFVNQSKLLDRVPVINNESVHMWEAEHFATTLTHHNIGIANFYEFQTAVSKFSQMLQEEPEALIGVTQATGTLLESINIALGFLFRDECMYMDDYRPALVRGSSDSFSNYKKKEAELISLRLICLNPHVVFNDLKDAKSIILASGTLTPLISLESELGAQFPLKISPKHVISSDRVWIGTLTSHPDGRPLVCKSGDTKQLDTQDALGQTILHVCKVTPNGVLCFIPSYQLMNNLVKRWQETGVYKQLTDLKHVFQESKNAKDHNDNMEDYYNYVSTEKGAVLFAVYRGKVSEGMDFKDHQARAVVTVGVPYPNVFDMAVKAKMQYNDKYTRTRKLLSGQEWLKVQAYRALNQAVGRCVRHISDWGAVLMIDSRFTNASYTEHLSKWVSGFLQNNHHTYESLLKSSNNLASFMQSMKIREEDEMLSSM